MPKSCRICYEDINEDLKYYCNCRGTTGFIHKKCLKKWINQNRTKNGTCEICKTKYTIVTKYDKIKMGSFIFISVAIYIVFIGISVYLINANMYVSSVSLALTVISIILASYLYYSMFNKYLNNIRKHFDIDILGIPVLINIYENTSNSDSSLASLASSNTIMYNSDSTTCTESTCSINDANDVETISSVNRMNLNKTSVV